MNTLQKVQEALEDANTWIPGMREAVGGEVFFQDARMMNLEAWHKQLKEALTELKAYQERLGSEQLVEELADAMFKAAIEFQYVSDKDNMYDSRCIYKEQAKAAIATIKG